MKRTLGILAACVATAALLAGCGTKSDDDAKATSTSVTETAAAVWKTLQNTHSQFLSTSCESETGPNFAACSGLQATRSKAFKVDVDQLPSSVTRTQLIDAVDRLQKADNDFVMNQCGVRTSIECATVPGMFNLAMSSIVTVVNREASAE